MSLAPQQYEDFFGPAATNIFNSNIGLEDVSNVGVAKPDSQKSYEMGTRPRGHQYVRLLRPHPTDLATGSEPTGNSPGTWLTSNLVPDGLWWFRWPSPQMVRPIGACQLTLARRNPFRLKGLRKSAWLSFSS